MASGDFHLLKQLQDREDLEQYRALYGPLPGRAKFVVPTIDPVTDPELAKFIDWFRDQRQKGLTDIRFRYEDMLLKHEPSTEEFFAELNRVIALPAVDVDDNFLDSVPRS